MDPENDDIPGQGYNVMGPTRRVYFIHMQAKSEKPEQGKAGIKIALFC